MYESLTISDQNGNVRFFIQEMGFADTSLNQITCDALKSVDLKFTEKKRLLEMIEDVSIYILKMHVNHIAHLDIKPHNILLMRAVGCYALIDFGLAEQYEGSNINLLEHGVYVGEEELLYIALH